MDLGWVWMRYGGGLKVGALGEGGRVRVRVMVEIESDDGERRNEKAQAFSFRRSQQCGWFLCGAVGRPQAL
jgi:hypothetical protein